MRSTPRQRGAGGGQNRSAYRQPTQYVRMEDSTRRKTPSNSRPNPQIAGGTMFLNDNGIQVLQWETMIPIEDIEVFDGRNGLVIPQKIAHFEKVFRVEGFRLPLTGRRLPNGRV